MTDDEYLDIIERAHTQNCGKGHFCYYETQYHTGSKLWRLSVVDDNTSGHWPLSDDRWLGYEREMIATARRLNKSRLGLTQREAAVIVAKSMGCKDVAA